jgi:predicted acyltransferase
MSRTDARVEVESLVVSDVRSEAAARPTRLVSLDQFRGYTVAGMFVVNFLGGFAVTPAVLSHHNTYCSYADTIMAQFLFATGFAFRLTFGRRARTEGPPAAYRRVARRLIALALLAILLYTLGAMPGIVRALPERGVGGVLLDLGKRDWFQALLHIAVTSLWVLPVIRSRPAVRVAYLIASAGAHAALSGWFNFAWVNSPPRGIDGGPLGFLTWAIPALVGTLACDAVANLPSPRLGQMLAWSVLLMLLGYLLSCGTRLYDVPPSQSPPPALADSPVLFSVDALGKRALSDLLAEPPFVPPPGPAARQGNYWMMSQRSGTISYQVFAAGFSLAMFVLFYLGCERLGWRIGLFRTLGTNALAAYVLGGMVEVAIKPFVPRAAPWWMVLGAFAVFFACACWLVRLLEKRGLLLRL